MDCTSWRAPALSMEEQAAAARTTSPLTAPVCGAAGGIMRIMGMRVRPTDLSAPALDMCVAANKKTSLCRPWTSLGPDASCHHPPILHSLAPKGPGGPRAGDAKAEPLSH